MAKYDLVLLRNDADSGVNYSEIRLGVPPDYGFALTQNPTTGVLGWKPAFLFVSTLADYTDLNTTTYSGFYDLPSNQNYTNIPSGNLPALLQVFDIKSLIIQILFAAAPDNDGTAIYYRRKVGNSWSLWVPFGQQGSPPVDMVSEQNVIDIINSHVRPLLVENPVVDLYELLPNKINHLILLYADLNQNNPPEFFSVFIPHQIHLSNGLFLSGSVYEICLMTNIPAKLIFLPDEGAMMGDQTVYPEVRNYFTLQPYKPVRLTCLADNTWLVEGTAPDNV